MAVSCCGSCLSAAVAADQYGNQDAKGSEKETQQAAQAAVALLFADEVGDDRPQQAAAEEPGPQTLVEFQQGRYEIDVHDVS